MAAVLVAAVLVGVVHVHHAPSHDSDAPFAELLAAAHVVGLDFVVLTEHARGSEPGPLRGSEHAGVHPGPDGRPLLVLVGAEFGSADGHVLGLDIAETFPQGDTDTGREVIEKIHAQGGFAVVPHPESYGGWGDWDAPFDGLEVQNNASDARRLVGPMLPFWLIRLALDRRGVMRAIWIRPERELAHWDRLLGEGRSVVGFAGSDAHQNTSLLGWQLDPYARIFATVQMRCPDGPLTAEYVWSALRSGHCWIRYALYDDRAGEAREVSFPTGRVELWLDDGKRVLEIRNPTVYSRTDEAHRPAQ